MTRAVACVHQPSRETNRTEVLRDEGCQNPKPSPVQACNRFDCPPMWDFHDWGQVQELSWKVPRTSAEPVLTSRVVFVNAVLPELWRWTSAEAGPVQTAAGGWQHPGTARHLLSI